MGQAVANSSLIDKYLADGKPIWIVNRTKSLLILDFKDALGTAQTFRLPPEQQPMNLSDYFPPSMIKENPNLRRLISHGHLTMMDPDKMEGKLSVKPAKSLAEIRSEKREKQAEEQAEALVPEEDLIEATPKIAFLCEQVHAKEMKQKEFIERLSSEKMSVDDLTYIINEMKGEDKIIGWATEKLADLKETNEAASASAEASEEIEAASNDEDGTTKAVQELTARAASGETHEEYKANKYKQGKHKHKHAHISLKRT